MKLTKKTFIIIITSMAGILLLGIASAWIFDSDPAIAMPDPSKQTDEEIHQYRESEEFKSLDRQQQRRYMQTAMQQRMQKTMDEYFALPEIDRVAYLDKVIDEMQRHMEQREQRRQEPRPENTSSQAGLNGNTESERPPRENPGDQPGRPGGGRRRQRTPEGMRSRTEMISPEDRARRVEFRKAIEKRMAERGISGGFGRGRR